MLRAAVGLTLAIALPFATAARAQSIICVTSEKNEPVYLLNDIRTDTPRLQADYGSNIVFKNIPCVTDNVLGVGSCETAANEKGFFDYFEINGSLSNGKVSVKHFVVGPRDKPNNGVAHEVTSSEWVAYVCQNSSLGEP